MFLTEWIRRSIRTELVLSLVLVLGVSAVATSYLVAHFQTERLDATRGDVSGTLQSADQALAASFAAVGDNVNRVLQRQVEQGGAAIADLLALVAPPAILSKDYMGLVNFVRAVNQNPGVAYAVYLDNDGKPLTRYLDKGKAILQQVVVDGSGKKRPLDQMIAASRALSALQVIERPVALDGAPLGKVVLGLDNSAAQADLQTLARQFHELVAQRERGSAELVAGVGTAFDELIHRSTQLLWAASLLSALTVSLISFAQISGVTRQLRRLIAMLQDVAEGDGNLTQRLTVKGHNELAELAQWFNRFIERTCDLVKDVKASSLGLASMAEQLSATTANIAQSNDAVSGQSQPTCSQPG